MIAIINYEMGNLRSVQKALERVGHEAVITDRPETVLTAEKVVLPGVGAFRDAMAALHQRELIEPIRQSIAEDKPFLGICLGLQLLFESSSEDGQHEGLGIIPGRVVRFDLPAGYKVPHMGWNQIQAQRSSPLLGGIDSGAYFYFVHSYHAEPTDQSLTLAAADYGGKFCAAVQRGNLFATQFHPEKSQADGLQLLKNFAEL